MLPPIINPSPGESAIPRASVIVFRGSPLIINPLVQGGVPGGGRLIIRRWGLCKRPPVQGRVREAGQVDVVSVKISVAILLSVGCRFLFFVRTCVLTEEGWGGVKELERPSQNGSSKQLNTYLYTPLT